MDLNSSDEAEPPGQRQPVAPPNMTQTAEAVSGPSMSGSAGPSSAADVLDHSTIGVPGLKTLVTGARIEVLWRHGWEPGTVKECLFMMDDQPIIMYRVAYDDGECMVEDLRQREVRMLSATEDPDVQITNEQRRVWTKLELVCCISRQRLTDPAKGAGCTHLPMCNFAQLSAYSAQSKQCPVLGCAASLSRRHAVVRDEKLRAALQAVSPSQEAVWVRGDELCLDAPDVSEAAFSAPAPPAPAAKRPQHLPRSSAEVVMKREVEIDDCRNMGSGLSGKRAMTSDRAHIVEPAAKKQALHPQEEQEQEEVKGMCGTPGCTLPDFHFGPCTSWDGLCGARKRRKPSRLADGAFEHYTVMDELGARKQPPNPCNKTEVRVRTEPPTATPARYCKAPTDPAPAAEVEVSHLAVSEVDETPGTGRSRLLELACYFEIKDDQIEPHVTVDCRDTARPLPGRQLPSRISHGPRRRRPQARQHQQQVVEQPDGPSPAPIPPLGAAKYYAEDTVKLGADGRSKWRVEVLAGPGATWVPENGAVHSLSQSTTPQSMQKAVGGAPPASAPPAAAAPKVWAEGTIAPLPAPTEAMHTAVTAGSSQATSESLKQTLGRVDGAQAADVVVARRRAPFAREKDASDYAFQAYLAQHPNDFPDESVEGVEAGMACAHCGRWCGNAGALTRHLTACTAKLAANDAQSQDLYAVERILGERRRHGKVEYLLSWLGFGASHNSWEPEENVLDHSVVEQWRTRRCGAVAEPRRQQEQATRAEAVVKEAQHTSDVPAASAAHPKKTGDESVSTNKRRFLAFARRDDKETFLGSFTTPEEAALLRVRTPWRGLKHLPQRGAPMVKMLVPDSVTAGERFTVRNPDDGRGHEMVVPEGVQGGDAIYLYLSQLGPSVTTSAIRNPHPSPPMASTKAAAPQRPETMKPVQLQL